MYIVEGNIGAGKSTFLRLLKKELPYISVALEPLELWHTEHGQSLLADFYGNPQRWAYTFETLTMMCRVREHTSEQQHKEPWRIMERSIYSGYYCFAKNSYQSGFLTKLEWSIYQDFFTFLTKDTCNTPQGFIYLKVKPEVALERTKRRNRSAETTIPLSYLQQIDQLHNEFLIEKKDIDNIPVLILDCNAEFESESAKFLQHVDAIKQFLHQTNHQSPGNNESINIKSRQCSL